MYSDFCLSTHHTIYSAGLVILASGWTLRRRWQFCSSDRWPREPNHHHWNYGMCISNSSGLEKLKEMFCYEEPVLIYVVQYLWMFFDTCSFISEFTRGRFFYLNFKYLVATSWMPTYMPSFSFYYTLALIGWHTGRKLHHVLS